MKKNIIIVCLLLLLVMSLTLVLTACQPDKDTPIYKDDEVVKPNETDIFLASNGATEYKLVVPATLKTKEKVARDEMTEFFRKSTGAELQVISDMGLSFDAEAKYISIGDTEILASSGVVVDSSELTSDGYVIVRKGNTVIIAGPSDYGTLYGVYGFLNYEIGFETYAEDEVYYEVNSELKLLDFNEKVAPDFEKRQLSYYPTNNNSTYRDRLRMEIHGNDWIYGSHSHFNVLPKATYYANHRDWYSPDGTQLCLTNEEMQEEFIKQLKVIITNHPDQHYILLGEMDSNTFCDCDNCKAAIEKYGTPSGVDMIFVNHVAREIQAWLDETNPDRVLYIGTFAYLKTLDAPVTKDENGNYSLTHPDVKAEPNVFIYFAPLHANFSYGFLDKEHNPETYESMMGWSQVCDRICVWTYSMNPWNYFVNFDNWGSQQLQYQELKQMGCQVLFDQGPWDAATPTFERLRIYLISKLMWDTELDTKKLISDFMTNYYKDAAEYMTAYYDYIRTYMAVIRAEFNQDNYCYVDYNKSQYWSKAYVDTCFDYFEKAIASVEHYKESDPTLYESLVKRIKLEKASVLFVALQQYQQSYTTSQQKAMIEEFEEIAKANNLTNWHESTNLALGDDGNLEARINAWRLALSN